MQTTSTKILKCKSLNKYQKLASKTAQYNSNYNNSLDKLIYTILGLNGEAGETAEVLKKIIRDDGGKVTYEKETRLLYELGDCLWYLSQAAKELGYSLQEVAEANLEKLFSRKDRGKIQGDGDTR